MMNKKQFEERIDALLEEYILDNPNYEDIHICYTLSWFGLADKWMIDVDITKQKK